MSADVQKATPGVDRVVLFTVRGHEFGFRRPSRADLSDVARRFALKIAPVTQSDIESRTIELLEGPALEWEARLEIGLAPRHARDGKSINLGERAPGHWLDNGAVSFANVDPEEFNEVCAFLQAAVFGAKKKAPEPPPSGSSAVDSING